MANGYYPQAPALPLHLCFFLLILFLLLGFSWYINYEHEAVFEGVIDQIKLLLMLSPLLLLFVVHFFYSGHGNRQWVPFFIPLPEKDSIHRAGGTPWGVAALLVCLMFMISYHSYFHEWWFPTLNRGIRGS